ncbi:MAG TPA: hypothetical protein VJM31_06750 [Vicinamibacterales bacterium]|nr:hypothetical protein [Vicinamibacterales bacterium]
MYLRNAALLLSLSVMAVRAFAQAPEQAPSPELVAPPSWAYIDLACAPMLAMEKKGEKVVLPVHRVIGAQDTANRDMLGPGDTLVISGGSNTGLEAGQRYFVRRRMKTLGGPTTPPTTIHTAGWIQILGVDTMLATATVVQACDGILLDDYLEPFVAPTIAAKTVPGTTPHYDNMGQIMPGVETISTGAQGHIMTIDRGSNAGVAVGHRFLVFRDKRRQRVETAHRSKAFADIEGNQPLVEIGQVLVVAVRADDSTVRILASKDAITVGDLIAPIR